MSKNNRKQTKNQKSNCVRPPQPKQAVRQLLVVINNNCIFPAFPEEPTAHVGRWRMWVENTKQLEGDDVYKEEYERSLSFHYSVMAKARSNLLLKGRLVQTSYLPGSEMKVILEPVLFGQPVALDEPVEVNLRRPDGVKRAIRLLQDENGAYHGVFKDTSL